MPVTRYSVTTNTGALVPVKIVLGNELTLSFIKAREEFLMNRIVQRNRAAPPWVEVQGG